MSGQIVRGGTLVTPGGVIRADIRIEDGVLAEIGPDLPGDNEIDAAGLHVFPATIDVHLAPVTFE